MDKKMKVQMEAVLESQSLARAIAAAYVDELDTDVLLRDLRIRRKIVTITAGVMAAILTLWMGVVGWAIVRELDSSNGHFLEEGVGYGEYVAP